MLKRLSLSLLILIALFAVGCAKANDGNSTNSALELVRDYPTVGYATDFQVTGDRIYVAEDQGGVSIFNKADGSKTWITSVSNHTQPLIKIRKISVVEEKNLMFLNEVDGTDLIYVVNYSNLDSLNLLTSITGGTQDTQQLRFELNPDDQTNFTVRGALVAGKTLVYKELNENGIVPWIESNTTNYPAEYSMSGFDWNGQYMFLAAQQRGFVIRSRANQQTVGSIDLPGEALKVEVSGDYAYVACAQSGLQVIDISNPTTPKLISSFPVSGSATSVDVEGQYAVLGAGSYGVYVLNILDPHHPKLIAHNTNLNYVNRAILNNGEVYTATRDGIQRFRIVR